MEAKCDDDDDDNDGLMPSHNDGDHLMTAVQTLLLTGVTDACRSASLSGADYSLVHRFPGPDLCLIPCLPGRERRQHRLQHLC